VIKTSKITEKTFLRVLLVSVDVLGVEGPLVSDCFVRSMAWLWLWLRLGLVYLLSDAK
jgi:hypothetical protein